MFHNLLQGWVSLYANNALVRTLVVFVHVGGLLLGGGAAVVADRATLRAFHRGESERARQLQDLAATHRLVLASLAAVIATGLLQFFSDTATFLHTWIFFTKMGLVLALLVNGALLTRFEAQAVARAPHAQREWRCLRAVSVLSLCLWLAITLAGAGLISM
ncbi:MAG TPA: hypothetical protein VMV31_02695 [Terriglobales bacterium]|nr:hypothetical protein [Terriglobales bacterium]